MGKWNLGMDYKSFNYFYRILASKIGLYCSDIKIASKVLSFDFYMKQQF